MAHTKSAKKSARQSEKNRQANRATKSAVGGLRTRLDEAVAGGDKAACKELFKKYCSALDKAVKVRKIKANTADRSKSRAALRIAAIK